MACPYYDICAKQQEDLPGFDWEDPACFGNTFADWTLCNVYLDLAFNVYKQEYDSNKVD